MSAGGVAIVTPMCMCVFVCVCGMIANKPSKQHIYIIFETPKNEKNYQKSNSNQFKSQIKNESFSNLPFKKHKWTKISKKKL